MKNSFKKYSNLITEGLSLILEGANIWDVYDKYYSDKISKEDYDIIAHIDPTCKGDNKGKYLPWLIKQYLEVKPTLGSWGIDYEDWLDELNEAWGIPLAWYDKHKDNEQLVSDINRLNIADICDYYDVYKDKIFTQKEIKSQAEIPYNDTEWEIVIPKTWEASKYYGANTKWCTASKDSAFHFKNYTQGEGNVGCEKPGDLYINIDKRNGKKYQFQFNNGEFFYEDDTTIMGNVIEATNMPENVVKWYFDNVPNAKLLTLNRTGHVQHYMLNTDFSKEIEISGGWSLVYDTEINEYVIYDKMNDYRLEDDDITCHYTTELINSALIGKNYVMMFQTEKEIILLHVVEDELKEYHFELLYNRYNIDRETENTFVFIQKYNYTNFAEYGLYIFDVLDENRDGNFTLEDASYEGEFKVEDDYYYSFRNSNELYTLVHIYDGIVSDKIEKIISYDYDEKLMSAVWTLIIDGEQVKWDENTGEILSNIRENVIKEDTNSFDIGSRYNYNRKRLPSKIDDETIEKLIEILDHFECDINHSYLYIGNTKKCLADLYNGKDEFEINQDEWNDINNGVPIHLLPPEEKRACKQIQGFIADRNAKMNKKLMMHDLEGNETGVMPLAKYNFYKRYGLGDSRKIKGKLVEYATPDSIIDNDFYLAYYDGGYAFIITPTEILYGENSNTTHGSMSFDVIASYYKDKPYTVTDYIMVSNDTERGKNEIVNKYGIEGLIEIKTLLQDTNTNRILGDKRLKFGRIWPNIEGHDYQTIISLWGMNRLMYTYLSSNLRQNGVYSSDYGNGRERKTWDCSDSSNNEIMTFDKFLFQQDSKNIVDCYYVFNKQLFYLSEDASSEIQGYFLCDRQQNPIIVNDVYYVDKQNGIFIIETNDYYLTFLNGLDYDDALENGDQKSIVGEFYPNLYNDYTEEDGWFLYDVRSASEFEFYYVNDSKNVIFNTSENTCVHVLNGSYKEIKNIESVLGEGVYELETDYPLYTTLYSIYCGEIIHEVSEVRYTDGDEFAYVKENSEDDWVKVSIYDGQVYNDNTDYDADNYSENFYENKKPIKKIYITENQLPIIKEYRQQLTIPFDGNPYKNGFEDFIDYLEEIGKYGTLPPCTDFENKYTEFDGLFHMEEYKTTIDSTLCDLIFYYSQRFLEKCLNEKLDEDLTEKFYDLDCNCDEPYLILDCMKEICENVNIPFVKYIAFVEDNIDNNPNLFYSFDINYDDNGLIEIERTIDLDYILEKPNNKKEIYPQIMDFYNEGLGLCWSWKSGNSESYNGNGSNEVVLYGRVNPNDVDWKETQTLNIYLPNETELRLKPNVPIQLDSIVIKNGELASKKIPLDNPIIVSSGTHY